jgi:hypothetical protein
VNASSFLVVDTDNSWIQKFIHRLEVLGLDEQFSVKQVVPRTSLSLREVVETSISAIAVEIENDLVSAIFVDIVIMEDGDLDTLGIEIVREVRRRWPEIPVFNVTGKLRGDQEQEIFSEATLEDVDGVFAKVFLYGEGASVARIRRILGVGRRGGRVSDRGKAYSREVVVTPRERETREAFGEPSLDAGLRLLIEDLGASEFWGLVGALLPHAEGTLAVINPGRSGAMVVKAVAKFRQVGRSATRPTSWILKISSDHDLLRREISGYKALAKTPLSRANYPRLLNDDVKIFGRLGGIAVEFEGDAEPLIDFLVERPDTKIVEKIASSLGNCLVALYGDPNKRVLRPWRRFYSITPDLEVRLIGSLYSLRPMVTGYVSEADLREVEIFVLAGGRQIKDVYEYQSELRVVDLHGDLNARNLLVSSQGEVILIDFASRKEGPVSFDVGKLERDLILKVADWKSPKFYDWRRVADWAALLFLDRVEVSGERVSALGEDLRPVGEMIKMIRALALRAEYETSWSEYKLALIYFFMLGVAHPDLSIQKKAFAVTVLARLLRSEE